ncbi:MAG: 3-isopropylmalate dehydratase small subunit [Acidobacteria bacterium]|nr:3-isopropylmalate dehydratase small subunit [Acidobacteriota bacterium]
MAQEIRRGGHAFDVHEGLAAPFLFDNVSTDVIAPALTNLTEGLDAPRGGRGPSRGSTAFANIRYHADGSPRRDFVFNQEAYRTASIMIVGRNYATGSSRVTGVTRPLAAWGVRVYIGESFGPIFLTNAVQYGVLTVELPRETLNEIVEWVESHHGVRMRVDLERQLIEMPGRDPISFETDPRVRNKLLNGLHDLEEIQPHLPAARAMRARDVEERPWIYRPADERR